jgi:peroxiredoxin
MPYIFAAAATLLLLPAQAPPAKPAAKNGDILPAGTKAPDFILVDFKTRLPTAMADQRGKAVVLLFWNLENVHARTYLNELETLGRKYGISGVVVLAVNTADDRGKLFDYAKDRTFNTRLLLNGARTAERYGVKNVPAVFVVDADGVIRDARKDPYTKQAMTEIEEKVKSVAPTK